ncbi:DNA-binding response regulator, LuxR family [Aquipluma nitroreducens]|uniref:DNA-binding response regulator, LuxR family n=1 Tax=Aquipluma nitroreducens TaxID=2010828 RepID=A0A5K7S4L7_9BACT|nr:response regulator transcription factor [Aquipluma nitroreducens]BBE16498.1 DNA-binding response regulator, LuxR family [Aquipluma nitroreducens]
MIDIAIFDEHRLVLEGVSGLLSGISDFRVVLSCDNREVLVEKLKSIQIHVLILNMHDISVRNLNLIVQLNISSPKLKILIVSVIDNEEIVLKTIKAGAKGFLGKDADRNSLMEAIYTLRNGHDYYSKSITHLLLNRYISGLKADELSQSADLANLSSRQVEILKLWGESQTNQEIADRFFISVRTVESHKNHIMQKLNLKSTVDLVKFAIKNNIIEI